MSQVQIVGGEQIQATVGPVPPRYRWLIRGFVIVAVCVAALVALRVVWGRHQWSKLETTVAAIAARGEPIHFEDMKRPPVADADNAAWYYRKAMATWPRVGSQNQLITETDWFTHDASNATGPRPPDPITDNAASLASLEPVFTLLRQAGEAPDCDWGVQLQRPAINMIFSKLGEHRRLARQIADAARRAHELGRDDLNLELTNRMLQLADRLNVRPQMILGHLVAISIRALAIDHIQQTLPAWRLGTDPAGADRVLVQHILDNLLDESKHVEDVRQALIGERWFYYDTMLSVIDGSLAVSNFGGTPPATFQILSAVAGPVSVADLNDMLVSFDRLLEDRDAFAHSNALQRRVEESFGHRIDFVSNQRSTPRAQLQYWLGNILLSAFDTFGCTHIRYLARCRLSAAAIAIRLFQIDHGQRPEALDALAPAYLVSIPLDPYGPVGQPIHYRREGIVPEINPDLPWYSSSRTTGNQTPNPLDVFETPSAMPLAYSVGADGVDNGGLWMLDHDGSIESDRQYWGTPPGYDHVFPLEPLQPPVKKSAVAPTDTSEGGGDTSGSPGLDHQGRVPGGEGDAQREEGEEQHP